jgi:putative ABC transport system ATP-binding protein
MTQSILRLENVYKIYDMGKAGPLTVLSKINLDIKKGEFIAITGASGSGKSTMMNLIGALDAPSKGEIFLQDKNLKAFSESLLASFRGKTIGFIFQQFNLVPTLTALENVMLPMEFIDLPETVTEKRAKYLLTILGLADRMHHKPGELSGGQQQRVAIARALANNPEIILADEPTGNLDSHTGKFVMDFLHKLNTEEGKTVILITHDLNLINYAKRVIFLKDGFITKDTHNGKGEQK